MLVSIETAVGDEPPAPAKKQKRSASPSGRWSRDKPVREVVLEAAHEFTGADKDVEFTPGDLFEIILKKYPEFNRATVPVNLSAGCPNHPSQKHHSVKHDYYWRVGRGKYRLYDPERDEADEAAS